MRILIVTALAALLAAVPGTASADEAPVGNAHFRTPGVAVYDLDAPGLACRAFGQCGAGFTALLHDQATPRLLSSHAGAAVRVTCQRDNSYHVRLFGDGDNVIDGWADVAGIATDGPVTRSRCV